MYDSSVCAGGRGFGRRLHEELENDPNEWFIDYYDELVSIDSDLVDSIDYEYELMEDLSETMDAWNDMK